MSRGKWENQPNPALFSAETRSRTLWANCSSVMDGSRVDCQTSQGIRSQEAQVAKRCFPAQHP